MGFQNPSLYVATASNRDLCIGSPLLCRKEIVLVDQRFQKAKLYATCYQQESIILTLKVPEPKSEGQVRGQDACRCSDR